MFALGLLIAAGFGAAALRATFGPRGAGPGGGLLTAVLGAGLGVALLSALRFAALVVGLPSGGYRAVEGGLLLVAVVAAAVAIRRKKDVLEADADPRAPVGGFRVGQVILSIVVVIQLAAAVLVFRAATVLVSFGSWDSWGFWNTRARLLAVPDDGWRRAFDGTVAHADYPLLLPLTVVRGWDWAGSFTGPVAFATGAAFTILTAALLFTLLRALRATSVGLMAVAVFLATGVSHDAGPNGVSSHWSLLLWAASQYADIPLAFYYLASLGCMALAVERPAQAGRWLFALGLSLTAAAWTKNEGLPWAVVGVLTTSVVILVRGVPRTGFFWFLAGLIPLAAALVAFKLAFAGPNDLVEGQAGGTLDKLLDTNRHRVICEYLFAVLPRWLIWLPVVGLLLGVRGGTGLRVTAWLAAQLVAVAAGYYAVYLLTPHDLRWHLGTSINRLVMQLWPGFIFGVFYLFRTPEEVLNGRRADARQTENSP